MGKINILPASVYNRIAAGEVVERPYSVVKELVENSIDAGATEISVYIEKGGKQLIRVVDNGWGIAREDLQSAFLPHATSKIAKAEDLDSILTLGFRGEAVASIASVSKMTITSKTDGAKCYSLRSDGGVLSEITEAAGTENGTDVKVEMLFFNTPVRLGFLKSDKSEEADITTCVSRFILCRPDIAFTCYINDKKVLQSFGGGEEEAFVSVYGVKTLERCYKIDATKHGIRIHGYIGDQNYFKPNKSYQSVFLNGRYIVNGTISSAMHGAYADYMMKKQYPFYVLHIQMPTELVDVNVHPNKIDVRFPDNGMIFAIIRSIVAPILDGHSKALDYVVMDTPAQQPSLQEQTVLPVETVPKTKENSYQKSISQSILEMSEAEGIKKSTENTQSVFGFSTLSYEEAQQEIRESAPQFKAPKTEFEQPAQPIKGFIPADQIGPFTGKLRVISAFEEKQPRPSKKDPEKLLKKFPDLHFERAYIEVNDPVYEQAKKSGENVDYFEENKRLLQEMDEKAKQNKIDVSGCKYAGKLFNTYLLYERNDEVYIIDQHAAHERLIFNRLKERMQNRNVPGQTMLVPYEISLNAFESVFIREKLDDIRAMGFEIDEGDANTFKVYTVPLDLQSIDLAKFFNEILADISGLRAIKLEEILKDKLASAACKAAVKGGMDLTQEEIDALFVLMDGDMGLKCPHGRPVVVKMTKTQLEKMFKRIV